MKGEHFMTIWEQALSTLTDLWDLAIGVLDLVEDALATNLFVQIMFAMVVFGLGYFVVGRIVRLVKKIAGAGK
jgi:hypothetical protein